MTEPKYPIPSDLASLNALYHQIDPADPADELVRDWFLWRLVGLNQIKIEQKLYSPAYPLKGDSKESKEDSNDSN